MTNRKRPEAHVQLDYVDGAWKLSDRETGDGHARIGPNPVGTIVLFRLNSESTPVGHPVGGRIAQALTFLDELWDLGIGPLEPAPAAFAT
jgi:hypothetical protein